MSMLNVKAFAGLLVLLLVMAGLLFLPARVNHFWQAWVFLAVFFAPALAVTVYLMKNDPELLERRMNGGPTAEKEPAQRIIMFLVSLGFIGLMVFPALDHRFGWSHMPPVVALAGDLLVLLGWLAIYYVFRANSYAAATI
jgi:protein-S-isoprenylcysteine O-methyltransferase Ste14